MKKNALGRGLDVLIPQGESTPDGVLSISIDEIKRNPDQPRKHFDEDKLQQLADSIKANGILQPLLVEEENGYYKIVAGERRYRAARLAGLSEVPCIVRSFTKQDRMEAAIIENIQREDLDPIEKARGLQDLIHECGYTQEACSKRIGISRSAVANLLRLLSLPKEVISLIQSGSLSEGHAKVLCGIKDENKLKSLAQEAAEKQLSVRALEALIEEPTEVPTAVKPPKPQAELALELKDLQDRFLKASGIKPQIRGNLKKGTFILNYKNETELEQIYDLLLQLENH